MKSKMSESEEEWRKTFTPEEFHVLRGKGTERPFTGKYVDYKKKRTYECAGCGNKLLSSHTKSDSGTGWPSFWASVSEGSVDTKPDNSLGMRRTEVLCSTCGRHPRHVFNDGPKHTGNRFCINSVALHFKEQKESAEETED